MPKTTVDSAELRGQSPSETSVIRVSAEASIIKWIEPPRVSTRSTRKNSSDTWELGLDLRFDLQRMCVREPLRCAILSWMDWIPRLHGETLDHLQWRPRGVWSSMSRGWWEGTRTRKMRTRRRRRNLSWRGSRSLGRNWWPSSACSWSSPRDCIVSIWQCLRRSTVDLSCPARFRIFTCSSRSFQGYFSCSCGVSPWSFQILSTVIIIMLFSPHESGASFFFFLQFLNIMSCWWNCSESNKKVADCNFYSLVRIDMPNFLDLHLDLSIYHYETEFILRLRWLRQLIMSPTNVIETVLFLESATNDIGFRTKFSHFLGFEWM